MSSQKPLGTLRSSQKLLIIPESSQEILGVPKTHTSPQEFLGTPRSSQELLGSPRSSQEASGSLRFSVTFHCFFICQLVQASHTPLKQYVFIGFPYFSWLRLPINLLQTLTFVRFFIFQLLQISSTPFKNICVPLIFHSSFGVAPQSFPGKTQEGPGDAFGPASQQDPLCAASQLASHPSSQPASQAASRLVSKLLRFLLILVHWACSSRGGQRGWTRNDGGL